MKFGTKHEEGFTGLEAAIVLIAFVVVAAVFSYVMLGAGFFTSQKSQEVVHTSVETASASIEIRGDVLGRASAPLSGIDTIEFAISQTAGGSPVDLNAVMMTYATSEGVWTLDHDTTNEPTAKNDVATADPADGEWQIYQKLNGDGDQLLEKGEQFIIRAKLNAATTTLLVANEAFSLEIKPSVGSALGLKRSAPAQIDTINLLY